MRGLAAVARLELERRWTLLPLALGVGFLPFVLHPFLDVPFGETRGIAFLVACLLAAATAVFLGATTLAGDLAAGRLGFYFSRPLPWGAIWGGKLAVTLGLAFAAGLLVVLPALLFTPPQSFWPHPPLAFAIAVGVAAIGIAHWGAVVSRARSTWLVLDVIALPLVVWAFRDAMERIVEQRFFFTAWGLALLCGPVVLAIHTAGAAQVAQGRTSARRSHAVASLTGWASLALIAMSWQLAARTGFRVDGRNLEHAYLAMASPSGDTAWFRGAVRTLAFRGFYHESFLASPGGVQPIGLTASASGFAFSGDATRAVWMRHARGGFELCRHDLASGATSTVTLRPSPKGWPVLQRRVLADEDAGRVAVIQDGATGVYDAKSGQRLAVLEDAEGARVEYVAFRRAGPDRVYRAAPDGGLAIEELSGDATRPSGSLDPPAEGSWRSMHLDASGERMLAIASREARLVEAGTGDGLAAFSAKWLHAGLLLSDGRVLIAGTVGGDASLRLYDATGVPLDEVDIGPASSAHLLEARPGRVVAAVSDGDADRLITADVDPLQVVREERELIWRPPQGPWLPVRWDRPAGASLLVSRVASLEPGRPRSTLLRYDVESGSAEWVAGPR